MNEPLDELYFKWLYRQVSSVRIKNPARTYWSLLKLLYTKEFVWIIPNDDNRAEDGRQLRYEFLEEIGVESRDDEWMSLNCSFLEMLIGLSRRLAFEDEGEPRDWFWHLISILDLDIYRDNIVIPTQEVDEILNTVIYRTYRRNGVGGLFPLRHPREDQREVELWYQLNAYLLEND